MSVLIKPILTEKTDKLTKKESVYTFVVDKNANKLQIKEAIETSFNVEVENVNTCIMPSKTRSRSTKKQYIKGSVPSFKKAYIKLAEGNEIDFYAEG